MKKNLSRQDFVLLFGALVIFPLITSHPLQGQQPGSVDLSFQTEISSNASIAVLTLQKDGKLIVAGDFNSVGGIPRNRVARLNSDGSLDGTFDPGAGPSGGPGSYEGKITALTLQNDGRPLLGGYFTMVDGVGRRNLARLTQDGSFDASFDSLLVPENEQLQAVTSISEQRDGGLLVAGSLASFAGFDANGIVRLRSDGSLDTNFLFTAEKPNLFPIVYTRTLALQSDGKILAGRIGFDTAAYDYLFRLNADGSPDSTFKSGTLRSVSAILVQADGKIIIGGRFDWLNGGGFRSSVVRLNPDGSSDPTFTPALTRGLSVLLPVPVSSMALQSDGKILIGGSLNVGGSFTQVNGVSVQNLARLNSDGSLDTTFLSSSGPDGDVNTILIAPDGNIIIGGAFTHVDGVPRSGVARLFSGGPPSAPPTITTQPKDQQVILGGNSGLAVSVESSLTPTYQWRFNGTAIPGATNRNVQLENVSFPQSGDYTVSVSNSVGSVTSNPARLSIFVVPAGSVDSAFPVGNGASGFLNAIALQTDGKILVAGTFAGINSSPRLGIERLNVDGSPDPNFGADLGSFSVKAVKIANDGKILVAGNFTTINGTDRNGIARLDFNGNLDLSFSTDPGPARDIRTIALQPDGKLLIGGVFYYRENDAGSYTHIVRLNSNGLLDPSFNRTLATYTCGVCPNPTSVNSIAVQPDGKILIGGLFNISTIENLGNKSFIRVNPDGSGDTNFNPGLRLESSDELDRSVPTIDVIALQPDGKIVIAGHFSLPHDPRILKVARFNPDGTLDSAFGMISDDQVQISTLELQPDGSILIGGTFRKIHGEIRNNAARLKPDGTLDETFDPGAGPNGEVHSVAVQPDGNILIAGTFTRVSSMARSGIARLYGAPDSVPRLINATRAANSFRFSILTRAPYTYVFEYKNSLSESSWTPLSTSIGDGGLKNLSDENATRGQRFYRVHVE
jgi:uncharacterized delta-60 repeat protein